MLSPVTYEVGQEAIDTRRRAHTTPLAASSSARGSHPHRRLDSRPLFLHVSHLQAACFEN